MVTLFLKVTLVAPSLLSLIKTHYIHHAPVDDFMSLTEILQSFDN